jgi:hypothetical protein
MDDLKVPGGLIRGDRFCGKFFLGRGDVGAIVVIFPPFGIIFGVLDEGWRLMGRAWYRHALYGLWLLCTHNISN